MVKKEGKKRRRGERKWGGEHKGTGWLRWRQTKRESKEGGILIEGAIMRLVKNSQGIQLRP